VKKTIIDRRRKMANLAKDRRKLDPRAMDSGISSPLPLERDDPVTTDSELTPTRAPWKPLFQRAVDIFQRRTGDLAARVHSVVCQLGQRIRTIDFRVLARSAAPWPIAVIASAIWLLFGPFVTYAPHAHLDAWFYPGYFTNFSNMFHRAGMTYYVSRLSWIVPGMITFGIAPPLIANLLLISGVMGTAVASLYWMVRCYYGRAAGIIASAMLAANPYFASAVVWLYPDGAAIAYGMFGLACFLRPHGSRACNLFWGGAALLLSGLTNMSGAPMIVGVASVPFWQTRHAKYEWVRTGRMIAAGVISMTGVMMLVSRVLTGYWQPLLPQINVFFYSMQHPEWLRNMWGDPPFIAISTRLFVPEFLLVFGAVFLATRRTKPLVALPVYAAAAICCAIYAFQQFALHSVVLRVPYHSSYTVVPVIGLAAMMMGELLIGMPSRAARGLLAVLALALPILVNGKLSSYGHPALWIPLALLGAAAVLLLGLGMRRAACVLLVIATFAGPGLDASLAWVWARQAPIHSPNITSGPGGETFPWIMQLHAWLKPHLKTDTLVRFWWESEDEQSMFYASAAMFLDQRIILSEAFDSNSNETLRSHLGRRTLLVYLTVHPDKVPQRMTRFAQHGFISSNERRTVLPYLGKNIHVILFDLSPGQS
jgi:hypothetical protein